MSAKLYFSSAEAEKVFDHFDTNSDGVLHSRETILQVRKVYLSLEYTLPCHFGFAPANTHRLFILRAVLLL